MSVSPSLQRSFVITKIIYMNDHFWLLFSLIYLFQFISFRYRIDDPVLYLFEALVIFNHERPCGGVLSTEE